MKARSRLGLLISACLIFGLAALALAARTQATKKRTVSTTATASQTKNDPALLNPAALNEKAPEVYEVKFATTKGNFVVKVTRAWAPLGADRFYNLVKHHFYDDASFFRIVPGFIVQFGINALPQVSRVWQPATIKDDPVKQSNHRGFLTYAMGGPNTRTTQIFINLRDNSNLDKMGFSPFGEITGGMEVVDKLYSGYGDDPSQGGRGPDQGMIQSTGKAYLDQNFPKLDSIKSATLVDAGKSSGAAPKP